MKDILLKNAVIITMNPQREIIDRGYIYIKGDTIADIGRMHGSVDLPRARKEIDLEGKPLLPGLIDGHGHAGHCLTKTLGEHLGDEKWGRLVENIYYRYSDEDFWYTEGMLAAAERLKFGVTSGVSIVGSTPRIDDIFAVRSSIEGAVKAGIRSLTGIGSANGPWPKKARRYKEDGSYTEYDVYPETAWTTTEEAVKELNGINPRQKCIVAPGRMGVRGGETREMNIRHNEEMYRIATKYNVPIHTHAYGGDVKFLKDTNPDILDYNISLSHSTGYSDEEISFLAGSNAYVFHGPTTHAYIHKRCPVVEMLDAGVKVAIVTDGTSPDRSFDLWRDMRNVQLLQRAHFHDTKLLSCGKVLEMTTVEPAKALGIFEEVGSLEVGKKADIIAVNTRQPHLAPFRIMPIQRLVSHASGEDVELVIVNGEIMMENRKLTQIDEDELLSHSEEVFYKMLERGGIAADSEVLVNNNLYGVHQ